MPQTHLRGSSETISNRDAYWIPGALIAASLLLGIGIISIPQTAGAFWPFSVLRAAEGSDTTVFMHDSSLKLLAGALNPDPSPVQAPNELSLSEGSALMANAGIDGTVGPDEGHSSTGGTISSYVVQEGDSISTIASMYGVSIDTILWANGLTRKSAIRPGMTLVVLPVSGVRHKVLKGETLAGVAKKFSSDVEEIASYNGIEPGAGLVAGTELIIPGGELSTPVVKKVVTAVSTSVARIKTGGSMGAVRAVGDTSHVSSFSNPVPAGRVSQGIHGWNGIDFAAPLGSPVYAAAGGTVIVSRMGGWNGGYGNYIVIDHGDGTQTLYAHLSAISISVGQKATRGQAIGAVGNTGKSTGYHLHFEVRGAKNPFAK